MPVAPSSAPYEERSTVQLAPPRPQPMVERVSRVEAEHAQVEWTSIEPTTTRRITTAPAPVSPARKRPRVEPVADHVPEHRARPSLQRVERRQTQLSAPPVPTPTRGLLARAADVVRRRSTPVAALALPTIPAPESRAARRGAPVHVAVAVPAPPHPATRAVPAAAREAAPVATESSQSAESGTHAPSAAPVRVDAVAPRPRQRLTPAPRAIARSASTTPSVGRVLARAESEGGGGGGGGGGDADAIYDEILRRLRVEQEQIGQLIPHPF